MDTDAIARLGYALALQEVGVEKQAFLRAAVGGALRGLGGAARGIGPGISNFMKRPAYNAGAFVRKHPIGAAAGLTMGGLGAKDLASAAGGGWSGEGNLGWHRQRMQGADYNSSSKGWASPTAWMRTLGSPIKSTAATMFGGQGPASIQGAQEVSGGNWVTDPSNPGRQIRQGAQISRSQTWSPEIQGKHKAWQQAKTKYREMQQEQLAKLEQLRAGEVGPRTASSRRSQADMSDVDWEQQARRDMEGKLQAEQKRYDTGDYGGGGWFSRSPNASARAKEIADLEQGLQSAGAGSLLPRPAAPRRAPSTPSMQPPGATSGSRAAWNYGLVPVGT